jgi:hypothetical protein
MPACAEDGATFDKVGVDDIVEALPAGAEIQKLAGLHGVIHILLRAHVGGMPLLKKRGEPSPTLLPGLLVDARAVAVHLVLADLLGCPDVADVVVVAVKYFGIEVAEESVHALARTRLAGNAVEVGDVLGQVHRGAACGSRGTLEERVVGRMKILRFRPGNHDLRNAQHPAAAF